MLDAAEPAMSAFSAGGRGVDINADWHLWKGRDPSALDQTATFAALGEGDAFNAAICSELARAGHRDEGGGALAGR